jgi:hypothetical protein
MTQAGFPFLPLAHGVHALGGGTIFPDGGGEVPSHASRKMEYGGRRGRRRGAKNPPQSDLAIRRRQRAPSCCTCAHAMLAKPRF